MHLYLSILFAALAAILLFSPETILDRNTQNAQLKMVYDNAMYIGIVCAGIAYYFYCCHESHQGMQTLPNTTTTTSVEASDLPTYEDVSTGKE